LVWQDAIKNQRVDILFAAGRLHPFSTLGGFPCECTSSAAPWIRSGSRRGVACGGVAMSCFYQSARKAAEWNTMETNRTRKMEQ
jgi:hypothetical protein